MKKFLLIFLVTFFFGKIQAQTDYSLYIATEILAPTPQSGPYNYFGFRLINSYSEPLHVQGYMREEGGTDTPNYDIDVYLSAYEDFSSSSFVYQLGPTSGAEIFITSVTPY